MAGRSDIAEVGACTVRATRDEVLDDLAIVRLRVRGADQLDDVAELSHDQVVARLADAEHLVRRCADRLAVLEKRGEHRSPWNECADRAGVVVVGNTKAPGLGARELAARRAQQALATTAVTGLRLLRDEPWERVLGMVSFERPEARLAWSRAWHDHLDATRDFLRGRREQGLEPKRAPDPFPLFQARRGHVTRTTTSDEAPVPLPAPPRGLATLTRYRSLVGSLGAYVTPPPSGAARRPAVLWAHDEGQLEADAWREGQLADVVRVFHDAGIVVMVPTWRGENGNRGTRELLYGEVDDLLSARAHLEALPYVDPDRIHLVGPRMGGALVLLAAGESTRFRAAFALGTQPDLAAAIRDDEVDPPFDRADAQETRLRSPIEFVNHIQRPTYLVQEDWFFHEEADEAADLAPRTLHSYAVRVGEDDFLVSMARLLARRIAEDDPSVPFELTLEDVQKATESVR